MLKRARGARTSSTSETNGLCRSGALDGGFEFTHGRAAHLAQHCRPGDRASDFSNSLKYFVREFFELFGLGFATFAFPSIRCAFLGSSPWTTHALLPFRHHLPHSIQPTETAPRIGLFLASSHPSFSAVFHIESPNQCMEAALDLHLAVQESKEVDLLTVTISHPPL